VRTPANTLAVIAVMAKQCESLLRPTTLLQFTKNTVIPAELLSMAASTPTYMFEGKKYGLALPTTLALASVRRDKRVSNFAMLCA